MKTRNKIGIRIILMLLSSGVLYAEEAGIHFVRKGETFSQIAKTYFGKPIYRLGKGSLEKLKHLNPQIPNVDLIFPGQQVYLGYAESAQKEASTTPLKSSRVTASEEMTSAGDKKINVLSPVQMKADSRDSEVGHQAIFSANYGMTTLSAVDNLTGTSANLFSSYDLTVSAGWQQDWTPTFSTLFALNLRTLDFRPSTNSAKILTNTGKTATELLLEAKHKMNSALALSFGAGYGTRLFLHGMDSFTVTVDMVPVPSVYFGAEWESFKKGKTSFGLIGKFEHLFSSNTDTYSVSAGSEYGGALFVRREYGDGKTVELKLGYHDRLQNTSLVNLRENGFFGGLHFSVPLFEGDRP